MAKEKIGVEVMPEANDNILLVAERKLDCLEKWACWNWHIHNWVVALSIIGAIAVPFGLAILLYAQITWLNVVLLVVSATSLILFILNSVLQLSRRAVRARKARSNMLLLIADYKDGVITREQFRKNLEDEFGFCDDEEPAQ